MAKEKSEECFQMIHYELFQIYFHILFFSPLKSLLQ